MLSHICPCRESARRGPRCARRFVLAIEALRRTSMQVPALRVAVLRGGFDQWVRRFWKNPMLVQGYDDEYWGYAELELMRRKRAKDSIPRPNVSSPTDFTTATQTETSSLASESNTSPPAHAKEILTGHRAHSLYSRPVDQPATPWSDAGSDIAGAIADTIVNGTNNTNRSETIPDTSDTSGATTGASSVLGTGVAASPPVSVVDGVTTKPPL